MKLFQIKVRADLQSEHVDYERVIAEDRDDAMRRANVPDFTLLTAVEIVEPGFFLSLELGNASMSTAEHVVRELRAVADQLEADPQSEGTISEINGHTVGGFVLTLPEPPTESRKARNVEEGSRIKIGDGFEKVECVGEMPDGRVEIITEPYSEGTLYEGDALVDVLIEDGA